MELQMELELELELEMGDGDGDGDGDGSWRWSWSRATCPKQQRSAAACSQPTLTRLTMTRASIDDSNAVHLVPQLTGLHELVLAGYYGGPALLGMGLAAFTLLTGLTRLAVCGSLHGYAMDRGGGGWSL